MSSAFAGDWTKIETPWFNVVSELSERRTRAWATEFEIYRRGLEQLIPVQRSQLEPVTIVLFSSDRRLNPFKPLEKGKPAKLAGYFLRMPGRNLIAIAAEGARDDTRELIYHEGVHWFLSGLDQRLPLWLEEGLGEIFGSFTLSGNTFTLGANRTYYTRHVGIAKAMPFVQLSSVRAGELQYNGKHGDQSQLFYAQSWVAVHDLLFTEGSVGWSTLRIFLAQSPTSDDVGKNFEEGFGVTPDAMDLRMKAYLRGTRLTTRKFTFDRTNIEAGFVTAPASVAEVDLVLGNLLLGSNRHDEAAAYFWRAAAAMPQDPRPREALAEVELGKRDISAALDHYRAAGALGGRSYAGYYLMGQASLRSLSLSGGMAGMSEDATQEAAENFVEAIKRNARFLPAYEALGMTAFGFSEASEAGKLVVEGARRFPFSAELHCGVSELARKRRDWVVAHAEATRAVALCREGDARVRRVALALVAASEAGARAASTAVGPAKAPAGSSEDAPKSPAPSSSQTP